MGPGSFVCCRACLAWYAIAAFSRPGTAAGIGGEVSWKPVDSNVMHTSGRGLLAAALCGLLWAPATAQSPPAATADSLFRARQWTDAASAYADLVRQDTADGRARYRLGVALLEAGEVERALGILAPMAERAGAHPFVFFQVGRAHVAAGRVAAALPWLQRAADAGLAPPPIEDDALFAGGAGDGRLADVLEALRRNREPCTVDPARRQFDFWVGTWDVHAPDGSYAGRNAIEPVNDGCALVERWSGAGGSTGTSLTYYDPLTRTWRQYWVASNGSVIALEGTYNDRVLAMEGWLISKEGDRSPFRGAWSLLEDGRVRQRFEGSADGGQTWSLWFDGYYTRVETIDTANEP